MRMWLNLNHKKEMFAQTKRILLHWLKTWEHLPNTRKYFDNNQLSNLSRSKTFNTLQRQRKFILTPQSEESFSLKCCRPCIHARNLSSVAIMAQVFRGDTSGPSLDVSWTPRPWSLQLPVWRLNVLLEVCREIRTFQSKLIFNRERLLLKILKDFFGGVFLLGEKPFPRGLKSSRKTGFRWKISYLSPNCFFFLQ